MENPRLLTHGGWLPLHFYLIAAALRVHMDTVLTPVLLHIFFSVATAIPLWGFVKREWNETGALFVAAAYLLYPLAFRIGFMALSEVPFLFFVAGSMFFLSRARETEKTADALLAGISLTLSSALRYEGWFLTPLLALVLWRKWKPLLVFLIVASLFPITWMAGNVANQMHPLALLPVQEHWELVVERARENYTFGEIFRRFSFFPLLVFFGLTPLLCIFCLYGVVQVWKTGKPQRIWFLAFAGLMLIFIIRCIQGVLAVQPRYTTILGLLLLPFSAEALISFKDKRRAVIIALIVLISIFPLSYSRVVLARVAGPSFPNPFPADIETISRVGNKPKQIVSAMHSHALASNDALIIDFFKAKDLYGWKDTYYVALMSRVHPSRLFIMPGAHQELDKRRLMSLLARYPSGALLYSDSSRDFKRTKDANGERITVDGLDIVLQVEPLSVVHGITLYRYRVI